ncbi:hypothetical protein COU79_01545, partial [Candidatus Peregrinibacteria bacterium CG10_big_fil_rev_8_21_14_0_10_54_7]
MEHSALLSHRLPRSPFKFAWFVSRVHGGWATGAIIAVLVGESLDQVLVVLLKLVIDAATTAAEMGFQDTSTMWLFGILFPVTYLLNENMW